MKFTARAQIGVLFALLAASFPAQADVGDPQVRTDHPWYPGELACSTFERLFATQAELYTRVIGSAPKTEEQKALAAWLWRNTHYWHGEEGARDLWGKGFEGGGDMRSREYWGGLFANGFGLCGTTHSQWVAEMDALLGHGRGRGVGVEGHNSFEVYLKGGAYGTGKWAMLDHDTSTVIFNRDGKALLSIAEVQKNWKQLTDRSFAPDRQHGWLVCGLYPGDGGAYQRYECAEYLAGYSGVPPMVHLRRGEKLRRYLTPGLDDGKTFVFWGRNYNIGGVPGPERSHTWVNQPEKMHGSRDGAGNRPGQARFANAVFTYRPDFASGAYREGVVAEDQEQVTFEFQSPYIIGATPPGNQAWGVYDPGCRNGLVLGGKATCNVSISTDSGAAWVNCGQFHNGLDLTDHVKGHCHYLIRFHTGARKLVDSGLTMVTVCQANSSILPHLKDGGTNARFQASGQAVTSAGPELPLAKAHLVDGQFGSPKVTLAMSTLRGEPVAAVYAAAHVMSSNPPRSDVKYQIEYSSDEGKSWKPVLADWHIPRMGEEPKDFWSQSLCWGSVVIKDQAVSKIRVRFKNDGGKSYARCEMHLVYRTAKNDGTKVTFDWVDDGGPHQASHVVAGKSSSAANSWMIPTGKNVRTRWVEFETK